MVKASAPLPLDRYVVALGSNQPHGRHGAPAAVLAAAVRAMADAGLTILRVSPTIASAPIGPSRRRYANGAVLIATALAPPHLLVLLKRIERDFGRRAGQRWGSRVLDLDIILWSGGRWRSRTLAIPHPRWHERAFVLSPLAVLVPHWRDPATGHTPRHLRARLHKPATRTVDPSRRRP